MQCLSHTRGLRDYCLLKRHRQEKFANEDAKLTEGPAVVPASPPASSSSSLPSLFVSFFFSTLHLLIFFLLRFVAPSVPAPAFSQVLTGLWDENEMESAINPRQLYSVFKEAVPYFSGYRWEELWNRVRTIAQIFYQSRTWQLERQLVLYTNKLKLFFYPVNRMHRSSSGSYWTNCTWRSTAGPTFAARWRSLNKNTPDSGEALKKYFSFGAIN